MKLKIMLLLPFIIYGQKQDLTIEDAIRIGIENNKGLKIAIKKIETSANKVKEQIGYKFPNLKFQSSYLYLSEVPEFKLPILNQTIFPFVQNTYLTKLTIQQPIFSGWRLTGLTEIAEEQKSISELEYDKEKMEIIFQIKSAYWNLLKAQKYEELCSKNLNLSKMLGEDVNKYYQKGMATENDLLKIKLKISNNEIQKYEAELNSETMQLALNLLIQQNYEYNLTSGLTKSEYKLKYLNEYVEIASSNRNELKIAKSKLNSSVINKSIINSTYYPQVYLIGNYNYSKPNQRYIPQENKFKDSWDIGVSFQFDIWNNLTNYYQSENAKLQIEQAEFGIDLQNDLIKMEVTQNYFGVKKSIEKYRLTELTVEQSEENLRLLKNKNQFDLATKLELAEAENILDHAKYQLLNSQLDIKIAIAKFEKSIGE